MEEKKIILRSFNVYSDMCLFSPGSELELLTNGDTEVDGTFSYLGDCFIGIYKRDNHIFIAVDKNEYPIECLSVLHEKIGLSRLLRVRVDGKEIETCVYKSEFSIKTWFLNIISFNDFYQSEEDYDYGLYISNLIKDKKRQGILLDPEGKY